jgi:hypothetical protein
MTEFFEVEVSGFCNLPNLSEYLEPLLLEKSSSASCFLYFIDREHLPVVMHLKCWKILYVNDAGLAAAVGGEGPCLTRFC